MAFVEGRPHTRVMFFNNKTRAINETWCRVPIWRGSFVVLRTCNHIKYTVFSFRANLSIINCNILMAYKDPGMRYIDYPLLCADKPMS